MSKATPVHTDPRVLRPIIEALIFASEEPLAPRLLVRLLAGERDEPRSKGADGQSTTESNADIAIDTESGADIAIDVESNADIAIDAGDAAADESVIDLDYSGSSTVSRQNAALNGESSEADDSLAIDAIARDDANDLVGTTNAADLASAYSDLMSDEPVESIDQRLVRRLVEDLNNAYEDSGRAFRIVEVAGGFQFATIRDYGEYVALLSKEKLRRRLSPAALETLAIIAFRQPISKPEVEGIRGVNSDQVLLSLLEKNLVCITGRSETVGRPLLYGTSEDFLRIFGLNSLSDLPKLREIEELMEDNAYSAERIEVVNVPLSSDAEEIEALVGAAGHPDEMMDLDDASIARDDEASDDSAMRASDDDADKSAKDGSNANAGIDNDWVDEVGSIGEDDAGMTNDSESHALDEIDAIDARDDAYEFTIGPGDGASDAALAHDELDSDSAAHAD